LTPGPSQSVYNPENLQQIGSVLAEIGRVISSSPDIEDVYSSFAQLVHTLIPVDRIVISSIDVENWTATIEHVFGSDIPLISQGSVISMHGTHAGELVHHRSGFVIQHDTLGKFTNQFPGMSDSVATGLNSFLGVPLIVCRRSRRRTALPFSKT